MTLVTPPVPTVCSPRSSRSGKKRPHTKGKITSELALATGYCIDVNAITRSGNAFTGDLTRPVLLIEDPHMR